MKKIFSILIITALLVTAFVLPVSATEIDYRYGDVIKDKELDVLDSLQILRHCAKIIEIKHIDYALADFDGDEQVSVIDATAIQMYLAQMIEHPRDEEYLEFYVELEDIDIKPYTGTGLLQNKAIEFELLFDEIYNVADDGRVWYDYEISGITDKTYFWSKSEIRSATPFVALSFPNVGIYEIKVKVYKPHLVGEYTISKRFEVLPAFEFDQLRFVDYNSLSNNPSDYPYSPEDSTQVEYQTVVDTRAFELGEGYGFSTVSERFVALVHTKEEYDKLFEIDNTQFDDEFFREKSLVVAVSPGYDHYDYSTIKNITVKDDVMYIKVVYGNSYPDPSTGHPTAPTWYSFASVDKADVQHITSVQRVR